MEVKFLTAIRTVTTAGTPEKLKATNEHIEHKMESVVITALSTNGGLIYITYGHGNTITTTGDRLTAGETWEMDVSDKPDAYIDLSNIWIDSAVDGEGVSYTAIEVLS